MPLANTKNCIVIVFSCNYVDDAVVKNAIRKATRPKDNVQFIYYESIKKHEKNVANNEKVIHNEVKILIENTFGYIRKNSELDVKDITAIKEIELIPQKPYNIKINGIPDFKEYDGIQTQLTIDGEKYENQSSIVFKGRETESNIHEVEYTIETKFGNKYKFSKKVKIPKLVKPEFTLSAPNAQDPFVVNIDLGGEINKEIKETRVYINEKPIDKVSSSIITEVLPAGEHVIKVQQIFENNSEYKNCYTEKRYKVSPPPLSIESSDVQIAQGEINYKVDFKAPRLDNTKWTWKFNDNVIGTGSDYQRRYTSPGEYSVTLSGEKEYHPGIVVETTPLTKTFKVSKITGVHYEATRNGFNNIRVGFTRSGNYDIEYTLQLTGNGVDSKITTAKNEYLFKALPYGSYEIQCSYGGTEADANLISLPASTLTLESPLKSSEIEGKSEIRQGNSVTLIVKPKFDNLRYEWKLGEKVQSSSNTETCTIKNLSPGLHTIKCTVTSADKEGNITLEHKVTVKAKPRPIKPPVEPSLPEKATFDVKRLSNDKVGITLKNERDNYTINWGDGSKDQEKKHTYKKSGKYTITLSVNGENNDTKTVTIKLQSSKTLFIIIISIVILGLIAGIFIFKKNSDVKKPRGCVVFKSYDDEVSQKIEISCQKEFNTEKDLGLDYEIRISYKKQQNCICIKKGNDIEINDKTKDQKIALKGEGNLEEGHEYEIYDKNAERQAVFKINQY